MEKKIYTSQSFVRRPLATFRSAYEGCKTIINHAQYPEGVFELTYRKREALTINKMPNIASTITESHEPGGRGSAKTATVAVNLSDDEEQNGKMANILEEAINLKVHINNTTFQL